MKLGKTAFESLNSIPRKFHQDRTKKNLAGLKTAENYLAFNILDMRIQAFLAFSFYTNGMKLFSVQKQNSAGIIGCINGIRALSSIWIVLFHSFVVYKSIPIQNIQTYSAVGLFNYNFILNWSSIILY